MRSEKERGRKRGWKEWGVKSEVEEEFEEWERVKMRRKSQMDEEDER